MKLPEPTDPRFPDALLEAKLIRWRMCQTPIVPIPLMLAPPSGDDLYFIRSGDAVKIGRARDVGARMVNMQVNNPVELDCICRLPNRGWEEKEWHERFQHLVVRGEWFKWVPELAEAINAARIQFAEAMAA